MEKNDAALMKLGRELEADGVDITEFTSLPIKDEQSETVDRTMVYTYADIVKAFNAGRKNYKECGNTNDDCWDFLSWHYTNYIKN